MEERRKHRRYGLKESCIVNHSATVGTIIDIGRGGLSCFCLNHDECLDSKPGIVDIFCRKKDLWAGTLPVHVLESSIIPGKFVKEFSIRKCRIRFMPLDEEQTVQLESIIKTYADT